MTSHTTTTTSGDGPANRLLAGLPAAECDALLACAERVTLTFKQSLSAPNTIIPSVYFPITTVVAILVSMEDGQEAEVCTIGNEGLVGIPVLLGAATATGQTMCQIPGEAYRIAAKDFQMVLARQEAVLFRQLLRYTQVLFAQTVQLAACNQLHSSEARLCRWLIMAHDRVMNDTFPLTQEFLGQMLGIRRAGVSEIASRLQEAGLILYRRGTMTIIDRTRLEARACACYQVIRDEYERLFRT